MKTPTLLTLILLTATVALGQGVAINETGAEPDPSAMLDVTSTEKGILVPRITQAQRDAISNPATGLLIYQSDETPGFYYNAGSPATPLWKRIGEESTGYWSQSGDNIYCLDGNVGIGESAPQGKFHVSNPGAWSGITFSGTGLNDLEVDRSSYNTNGATHYAVRIQNSGPNPNLVEKSNDGGITWSSPFPIAPDIDMGYGVVINFGSTSGYAWNDCWDWTVNESFYDVMVVEAGNVGVGTTTPTALLHTKGTGTGEGNILFEGSRKNSNPGDPPVSGLGTRLMWYPDKAAFRVGYVSGTHWDKDSIGMYSVAFGVNTKASGSASVAMGSSTTASGLYSMAMGRETIASGNYSTAMGQGSKASGNYSTALGYNSNASGLHSTAMGLTTNASGDYSTVMGYLSTASGFYSTSMGNGSIASGYSSTAMGFLTTASGFYSIAMGQYTTAPSYAETVIGRYNTEYTPNAANGWSLFDRLFVIGNGTSSTNTGNALTMLKNGNTGFGVEAPTEKLDIDGQLRIRGGAPGNGKVLTSDANGVGSWQTPSYSNWMVSGSNLYRASGNIGIGTSAPGELLHVRNASGTAKIRVQSTNTSAIDFYNNTAYVAGIGVSVSEGHLFLYNGGNVSVKGGNLGIGNTTPDQKLDITAGNGRVQSGYNWLTNSDARYKTNVSTLENVLDKIAGINGVRYDLKEDTEIIPGQGKHIGFIAQELETEFPEFVVTGEDGYKSVAYDKMTAVLLQAVKEQQAIIDSHKEIIEQLKQRIESLEEER